MYITYPYQMNQQGLTARSTKSEHVRELIEQVLFTNPGERVNRPDFGSGLLNTVFTPASDLLTTANEFLVQGALQQWLGDIIQIEELEIGGEENILEVMIQYTVRETGEQVVERLSNVISQ